MIGEHGNGYRVVLLIFICDTLIQFSFHFELFGTFHCFECSKMNTCIDNKERHILGFVSTRLKLFMRSIFVCLQQIRSS
jgi:hypothetical protein